MKRESVAVARDAILRLIVVVRGQKVILDSDLAQLYGVTTGVLVQAVKRNLARFPADFMLQLSEDEFRNLKSQIVISSSHGAVEVVPTPSPSRGWRCCRASCGVLAPSR